MNHLKFAISLTLFITTFFAACKKDDDDDSGSENACKVTNVQYYDDGQPDETATYTYNGNQVTKVQFSNYNYTLEYSGNNITKRNYFVSAGATPELYDQISYNSDGTISKIESFEKSSATAYSPFLRLDFIYSSGKLNKTRYFAFDSTGASALALENTYTFTGNNITSLNFQNFADTTQGTVSYTYDTNPNFFKKQNSQIYIVDFLFNHFLFDDGSFLPMAFSENNVTKIVNTDISYESDTNQNLKDLKFGGDLIARYTYQCP
jgi:hypothetical protein